jgi:phosphohistidine phosphatase
VGGWVDDADHEVMHATTLSDRTTPAESAVGQTVRVRYLIVVRHAKAVPHDAGIEDFDRPLTDKGRRQAMALREWASDPDALGAYGPVTALVSASARTRETYALGFAGTPFVHALETSSLIYNGRRDVSPEDVLTELAAIDPVNESLMVVGHNPTVFELVHLLADGKVDALSGNKYPLGAAVVLKLRDDEPIGLRLYPFVRSFVPDV